jgi:endonuclease YncB( thermonuclease family)
MRADRLAVLLILLLTLIPAYGFSGKVVSITDGDTLKVLHAGRIEKIRLSSIDAPEHNQDFGQRAKQFVFRRCYGRMVTIQEFGKDRYGRTIGEVIQSDGADLNHALVEAGLAWWYQKYAPHDLELSKLERGARNQHLGLWSVPNPVPPWDFRHHRSTLIEVEKC